ncbi:MAG: hypothetical protein K2L56_00390, partial [Prevotella sp.]|nr:hypothetical protein [Prevotella sp.]
HYAEGSEKAVFVFIILNFGCSNLESLTAWKILRFQVFGIAHLLLFRANPADNQLVAFARVEFANLKIKIPWSEILEI